MKQKGTGLFCFIHTIEKCREVIRQKRIRKDKKVKPKSPVFGLGSKERMEK